MLIINIYFYVFSIQMTPIHNAGKQNKLSVPMKVGMLFVAFSYPLILIRRKEFDRQVVDRRDERGSLIPKA